MAKIQFLTILLAITCLLGDVVSVTDRNFENLVASAHRQAEKLEIQSGLIEHLRGENRDLVTFVHRQADLLEIQSAKIDKQSTSIEVMLKRIERQEALIAELTTRDMVPGDSDLVQNATIEERVTILEAQVVEIEDHITALSVGLTEVDENLDFLFDGQVIQDERLLNLEETSDEIISELDVIEDELENLQDTTLALDFRVTVLEQDGGGDGNSSIAELEVRVETLEGTAAGHETRISAAETDINALEGATSDLETRLTAAEEDIQGLQMTDVELDARVTALEENINSVNDTIAFHTVLTSYDTIPGGSTVQFNKVLLNKGDGYDNTTGMFTVPPGGDGFYYFSAYFFVRYYEYARIDIQLNGQTLCTAYTNQDEATGGGQAACSAATYATEGDTVQVVYRLGTDTTPLYATTSYYYNGFTGFRI